jgi:hypothetical protein
MMGTGVRFVLAAVLAVTTLSLVVEPAQAEPAGLSSRTGLDVSWPQCGADLPGGMAYAVVGVNGGTASTTNRCLTEQLAWAARSTTGADSRQPPVQLYVNTANPGDVLEKYGVTSWPTDSVDPRGGDSSSAASAARRNPYGRCATTPGRYRGYTNDLACSWQYGWNRAVEAVDDRFAPAARAAGISDVAADYTWWLDVETMNSWQQGGSGAAARNTAVLEGMTQLYLADGALTVGLYSTGYQWRQIVGRTLEAPPGGSPAVGANLIGLPSWLAGSSGSAQAELRCTTATGLTGGPVVLNQYVVGDLDHDHSCV